MATTRTKSGAGNRNAGGNVIPHIFVSGLHDVGPKGESLRTHGNYDIERPQLQTRAIAYTVLEFGFTTIPGGLSEAHKFSCALG